MSNFVLHIVYFFAGWMHTPFGAVCVYLLMASTLLYSLYGVWELRPKTLFDGKTRLSVRMMHLMFFSIGGCLLLQMLLCDGLAIYMATLPHTKFGGPLPWDQVAGLLCATSVFSALGVLAAQIWRSMMREAKPQS